MQKSFFRSWSTRKSITLVLFLIALGIGFLFWFFFKPLINFSSFGQNQLENLNQITPPSSTPIISSDLLLAKQILDQFTNGRSTEGFYGDEQFCDVDGENCNVVTYTYADVQEVSSYRYSISVAWARFKYWQKTHDEKEFILMQEDLSNIVVKVLDDPNWILQTDTYNCALLSEIIAVNEVNEEIKNNIGRICLEADFERAPLSNVSFDQHRHSAIAAMPVSKTANSSILAVVPVPDFDFSDTVFQRFQVVNLKNQINENLKKLIAGQRQNYSGEVSKEHQVNFMNRELIAAIDQNVAFKNSISASEAAHLHNLILTEETLAWFNNDPSLFSNADICLLKNNLSLYLRQNPQSFTTSEVEGFKNKVLNSQQQTFADQLNCALSDYFVNNDSQVLKNFLKTSKKNKDLESIWKMGYTENNGAVFPVMINAYLAGILSL